MSGDAETRTRPAKARKSTRRVVADRVEALTQPVPGHELADVRFERRTVISPRSARTVVIVIVALVVAVGGVMLIGDMRNSGGDEGGVVAGLSPMSEEVGASETGQGDNAGDTTGDDTGEDAGDGADRDDREGQRQGMVVVSVQGLVHHPGLLTVGRDKRVGEVIDQAGGVRADGRVQGINLAEPVLDGMQVVVDAEGSRVLYPGESAQSAQSANGTGAGKDTGDDNARPAADPAANSGLVDINQADMAGLTTLSGVGPATAEAIIAWRDTHGAFATVEQLMEVKGIGPAKFEALRDHVTV